MRHILIKRTNRNFASIGICKYVRRKGVEKSISKMIFLSCLFEFEIFFIIYFEQIN